MLLCVAGESWLRCADARGSEASAFSSRGDKIDVLYERYREGTLDASYDLSPVPALERSRQAGELGRVLDSIVETGRTP